jgi:hypothetical protein
LGEVVVEVGVAEIGGQRLFVVRPGGGLVVEGKRSVPGVVEGFGVIRVRLGAGAVLDELPEAGQGPGKLLAVELFHGFVVVRAVEVFEHGLVGAV